MIVLYRILHTVCAWGWGETARENCSKVNLATASCPLQLERAQRALAGAEANATEQAGAARQAEARFAEELARVGAALTQAQVQFLPVSMGFCFCTFYLLIL